MRTVATAGPTPTASPWPRRCAGGLLMLGVALTVGASRLWLIDRHGSDQPFHDQWGAEGFILFRSWLHGVLTPAFFFFPHSEHHPATTRLLAWIEFVINGQWDARVQMVVNAVIYSSFAALLVAWARRLGNAPVWTAAAWFTAILFALPANSENTLWGFQTHFYTLLLFGLLHVWGTCATERLDWRWCCAQLCGALALFTLASGAASSAALALLALRDLAAGRRSRWAWATLGTNAALVGAALWMLPVVASDPATHAKSPGQFMLALSHLLAWPIGAWWGAVLSAPLFVWLLDFVRRRSVRYEDRVVAAAAVWVWLLIALLAYGRGGVPERIATRYFDVLNVNLFLNGLVVLRTAGCAGKGSLIRVAAALAWIGLGSIGAWTVNRPSAALRSIERFEALLDRQKDAVREYLVTQDSAALTSDPTLRAFFPHLEFTTQVLQDPAMRGRLPPSLVPPLPLRRDPARSHGFETETSERVSSELGGLGEQQIFVSESLVGHGQKFLRFRVRGRLGPGGSQLVVQDEANRTFEPLGSSDAVRNDRWRTVHIRAPEGAFRVVATRPAGVPGVSFTAPIEVGVLSWLAPKIARQHLALAMIGLVGLVAGSAGVMAWRDGRRARRGHVSPPA